MTYVTPAGADRVPADRPGALPGRCAGDRRHGLDPARDADADDRSARHGQRNARGAHARVRKAQRPVRRGGAGRPARAPARARLAARREWRRGGPRAPARRVGRPAAARGGLPRPRHRSRRRAADRHRWARLARGELALDAEDGEELLRFSEPSPVGEWEATMFRQRDAVSSPLPGTEVTAVFGDDGTLSGSAGCNTYRATYTTDRGMIAIGETAVTKKACVEPAGVMEQEEAYLAALPLAASYRVEGTSLSLLTAEGTYVAIYQRAP